MRNSIDSEGKSMSARLWLGGGIVVGLLSILGMPMAAKAIGISPGSVVVEQIQPQQEVVREFIAVRGNPVQEEKLVVEVFGEAEDYILFPNGNAFTLPAGEKHTPIPFTIATQDLASGTYATKFKLSPVAPGQGEDGGGSGAVLLAGAQGEVIFTVTNEGIEEFSIENISILHSEVGMELGFSYRMQNTGSVDTNPERIRFVVQDAVSKEEKYTEEIARDAIPIVKANTTEDVFVETAAALDVGRYNAVIEVFGSENELLAKVEEAPFEIFPEGTLALDATLESFVIDKETYATEELVGITAQVKNNGELVTKGVLLVEVFKDDARIDYLRGEEVAIRPNRSGALELFFRPSEPGDYKLVGSVSYGPFTTDKQEVTFSVSSLGANAGMGVVIVGSIVLLVVIFLLWRKRRKNASGPHQQAPKAESHVRGQDSSQGE